MERWIVLPGGRHKITGPFGRRQSPNVRGGEAHFHNGVDLSAAMRTPVICPLPGIVVGEYYNDLGGHQLVIQHDNGYRTGYAHLDSYADNIKIGSRVSPGQTIAYSGCSGVSGRKRPDGSPRPYDPHLHFTARMGKDWIDPATVLAEHAEED